MGSICSKPSTLSGGHTLGSSSSSAGQPRPQPQPQPQPPEARRSQAAAAAEQRMSAQSKRGVSAANPNSGQLAARLQASKVAPPVPEEPMRRDTLIEDWRS